MDLDKSRIVFLLRPFLFVSCYPRGKVPGSYLNVDLENESSSWCWLTWLMSSWNSSTKL